MKLKEGYKHTLSVVTLTRNNSAKLKDCIESIKWADEIVIVDDNSKDNTCEIAKKYTDKVYTRTWENEGVHRNYAYSLAQGDYILSLDADERVTPELKEELQSLLKNGFEYDYYNLPHKNFIGDYWLRYGGWYPNAKLKLFNKRRLPLYKEEEYHPPVIMDGKSFTLQGNLIHLAYEDVATLISKLNHQTNYEAKKWFRDKRKMSVFRCIRKAVDRFIKAYLLKKGFKDGFIGFVMAISGGLYQILTYAKLRELKKRDSIKN